MYQDIQDTQVIFLQKNTKNQTFFFIKKQRKHTPDIILTKQKMAIQKRTIRKLMTVYNTPFCNESC